jgi:lactate dehydrogenase-like 2-hydroxyacid dehydrogenase
MITYIGHNTFDLEGKVIDTIGAGRIGYRVFQRLNALRLQGTSLLRLRSPA